MIINQSGGVLIAGGIAKHAELKYVGSNEIAKCTFSVAYGKDANGKSVYANCEAWRELAKVASDIRRGDSVLVAGHVEQHEYNGKTYKSIVCDYVSIAMATGLAQTEPQAAPTYSREVDGTAYGGSYQPNGFAQVDNDDLPF